MAVATHYATGKRKNAIARAWLSPGSGEMVVNARPLEQYFGLKEELESLFGRPVDLVESGASSNRYFLESVNKSRRLLYAA